MTGDETTENASMDIPEDATVIRQSSWAWQLPAAPWVLFSLASTFIEFFSFPVMLILTAIVVVPRYLRWKKALYILTEDHVIVFRGGLRGRQRFDLPIAEFADVSARPGIFGNSLGYRAVHITLRNGKAVILDYLPQDAPLVDHVQSRLRNETDEEGTHADGQTEGGSDGGDEHD